MSYGMRCFAPHRMPDAVDRTPVPDVARYDDWLAAQAPSARREWTGHRLRRIVVMRRRHEPDIDIARAVGKASSLPVRTIYGRLPAELQ